MITVPICLMADEKYIVPTTVMLSSLFENKNEDTKYSIYILADNMDENTISFFENQTKLNFEIKVVLSTSPAIKNFSSPADTTYNVFLGPRDNVSCTLRKLELLPVFIELEVLNTNKASIITPTIAKVYTIKLVKYPIFISVL